MRRALVCLLFASASPAQWFQRAGQYPVNLAVQEYWQALNAGHAAEAAANREKARQQLEQMAPMDPAFANSATSVAQIYQAGGMTAQARAVLQDSLARLDAASPRSRASVTLLTVLANFWEEDRNLLQAADCLGRAAATLDALPSDERSNPQFDRIEMFSGLRPHPVLAGFQNVYQSLASLYQRLGRHDALMSLLARMQPQAGKDVSGMAAVYENLGMFDEAEVLYRKAASAESGLQDTTDIVMSVESLAELYSREERFDEAADTMQRAISTARRLPGQSDAAQMNVFQEMLADFLRQAGRTVEGDRVYQELLGTALDESEQLQATNAYALYLSSSQRPAEAELALKSYLSSHSELSDGQQASVYSMLGNAAAASGQSSQAEEYWQTAAKKESSQTVDPEDSNAGYWRDARLALSKGDPNEAANRVTAAIDMSIPSDLNRALQLIPVIAAKAPDQAERLYQRLFAAAENWSAATFQPLLTASQNYPRFLMQHRELWPEIPAAVDRASDILIRSHGPVSEQTLTLILFQIDFARVRGSMAEAVPYAKRLLELEESLSGNTSENYMRAAQTAGRIFQDSGDGTDGLELFRRTVSIADLVYPKSDARRSAARITAAMAFAREKQFDDADRLAGEALAIARTSRPPLTENFRKQAEMIRAMRTPSQPLRNSSEMPTGVAGYIAGGISAAPPIRSKN